MNQIREENSAKTSEISERSRTVKGSVKDQIEDNIQHKLMHEKAKELSIILNYQLRAERISMDELVEHFVSPSELKSGQCQLGSIRKNL